MVYLSSFVLAGSQDVPAMQRLLQSVETARCATSAAGVDLIVEKQNSILLPCLYPIAQTIYIIRSHPSTQSLCSSNPQHKVNHNRPCEYHRQYCRAKPIIEAPLPSQPYTPRPPMKRHKRIDHAPHCHDCEQPGTDARSGIGAEVQQTD